MKSACHILYFYSGGGNDLLVSPSILISLVFDDQNPFHCVHTKPFIPCPVTVEYDG
jgi:hypothetical protein